MRPPTRTSLCALRALVGLVTVWCLGCSAFEPLLSQLFGRPDAVGMECGPGASQAPADGVGQPAVGAPERPEGAAAFSCGCQSCQVPSPTLAMLAPHEVPTPFVEPVQLTAPQSVEREPLVPPPQRAL
jgi:hypothetical protein